MSLHDTEKMTCFRLLATVLDEIWNDLDGDQAEKEAAVQSKLQVLQNRYRRLTNSPEIVDYRDPATRYAYLAIYVSSHANMVADLVRRNQRLQELIEQKVDQVEQETQVTCIGGGPGSDLLGILKQVEFLNVNDLRPRKLRFLLFDRESAWNESWIDVDKKLRSTLNLSTHFEQFDVTDKESWIKKKKYLESDLFTMIYFISEIYQVKDKARDFFINLFSKAKKGAYFIIIDNAAHLFYSWIDEIATDNRLETICSSDDITLQLPTDEEKRDLGAHLERIGQKPKLSGKVACRILHKP